MHSARSASGWRRSARRVSTSATRHSPVSASPTTPYPPPAAPGCLGRPPPTARPVGSPSAPAHRTTRPGAGVVQLGGGEWHRRVALGEVHRLGEPVGDPVVGHRRPDPLDVVALGGEVVADSVGDRTEPLVGEQPDAGARAPSTPRPCSTSSGCPTTGSIVARSNWAITAPSGNVLDARKRPSERGSSS